MLDKFVPDIYQQSIYTIDYKALKKNGIKCLLFDLDNTLAPVHAPKPAVKEKELIEGLKDMGFKVIIMSNSRKKRLEPFKNGFNVDTSASSRKPFKQKYKKILDIYRFKDTQVAAIGDQLLTDIFGANNQGFVSILVNPMSKEDLFFTRINRVFERMIMKRLNKKGLFTKGEYHD